MGNEEEGLSLWQKVFFIGSAVYGINETSKTNSDFDKRLMYAVGTAAVVGYKGPEVVQYAKDLVDKSSGKIDQNSVGVSLLSAAAGYLVASNYNNKKAKNELKE